MTSRAVAGVVVEIPNPVPLKNKLEFPNNPVPPVATLNILPQPVEPVMDTELPPPTAAGPVGPVGPITLDPHTTLESELEANCNIPNTVKVDIVAGVEATNVPFL